jgi:hypothetical protein
MNGVEFAPQALFAVSALRKRDLRYRRCCSLLLTLVVALLYRKDLQSQTASTGALTGVTLNPSGAVLTQVNLHLTTLDGSELMECDRNVNQFVERRGVR